MVIYRTRVNGQDQDSLLVKRRNGNHSPGPVIRELVPSSHQRTEPLSATFVTATIIMLSSMSAEWYNCTHNVSHN